MSFWSEATLALCHLHRMMLKNQVFSNDMHCTLPMQFFIQPICFCVLLHSLQAQATAIQSHPE
jgi:hypothetical protein